MNKQGIKDLITITKWMFEYAPGYMIFSTFFSVFVSVEMFFEYTYCKKFLLETIERGLPFQRALVFILFLITLIVIKLVFGAIKSDLFMPIAKEKIYGNIQKKLLLHASELDLEKYDTPEFYNDFVWSISDVEKRVDDIIEDFTGGVGVLSSIIITGSFVLINDKCGLIVLVICLMIIIICNMLSSKLQYKKELELKPINRKMNYYNRVFYLHNYAKEIRMNDIGGGLLRDYKDLNEQIFPVIKKYGKKIALINFLADFVPNMLLINTIYLGYLLIQYINGNIIGLGVILALYDALNNLKNNMFEMTKYFSKVQMHSYYASKIMYFFSINNKIVDGKRDCEEDFLNLTLKNVGFSYDERSKALENIDISINRGEKIAIVGYNGSGKSTLIKLLTRLYDVTEGEISYNGTNIKEYSVKKYREKFSVVFQDFNLYAATVAQNIKMGEVNRKEYAYIVNRINEMNMGDNFKRRLIDLESIVTHEFSEEGVDFSGGERQKLAILRTLVSTAPIILWDEPSSSLDPISEYKLNEILLKSLENKTLIYISHRLSATVDADYVYVFKRGRIIEAGSHDDLMKRNGEYAKMFRIQADKYKM